MDNYHFQDWAEYQAQQAEPVQEPPTQEPEPLTIKLYRGADLYKPQTVKWLVRSVIESSVLVGAFGAPASGKSFAAIDLALCIASGKDWYGHAVKQGSVVYFAGEGLAGLRRRLAAWVQRNPDKQQAVGDNFYLAERACHLPDELPDVLETLGSVPNLSMVVLDTLQRTMTGDENSTKDMSAYIQSLDSIKAAFPDLTIMVIHHTGHGASDRARGSSVLKASLDTEMLVAKDNSGIVTITSTKMKDAEPFKPLNFRLEGVMLDGWTDDEGEPVSSAVLLHLPNHEQVSGWRDKVRHKNQINAMLVLETLYQAQRRNLELSGFDAVGAQVRVSDWIDDCLKQGITRKKSQFEAEVIDKLIIRDAISIPAGSPYVQIVGG